METYKKNIILLGDGAVGKTCLIRRFVTDQFSDRYITTLGSKVTKKDVYLELDGRSLHVVLLIWDILGQKGYKYTQALSFGGIEGAMLVSDLTRKETLDSLSDYWVPSLVSVTGALPMLYLGNKSDLAGQTEFGLEDIKRAASERESCGLTTVAYTTSAKTGTGVEQAFGDLARAMMKITEKARLSYTQYIMDKTDVTGIKDVVDHIIADFSTQFGGVENAGPLIEKQIVEVGLDIDNPTKRELVELVNALARVEEMFKPANVVNLNRTKRLYLVNMM